MTKDTSIEAYNEILLKCLTSKLPVKVPKKPTKIKALLWNVSQITKQMKEQGPLFHEEAIFALEKLQNDDEPF